MTTTAAADPTAPRLDAKEATKRLGEIAGAFGELTSLLIRSPDHVDYRIRTSNG